MPGSLALYLVAINVATFAMFALDKRAAGRGGWRVPESRLLGLSLIGGAPAAFAACRILRHKTRKAPFRTRLRWIAIGQAACLAVAAVYRVLSAGLGLS